ncbi:MAG: hypothetical protein WAS21_14990 [Geminicoccaceae bacterium]
MSELLSDQITASSEMPKALKFHYIKASDFRTIHVDGAVGSVNGRGYIHAAVYSERKTLPRISAITFQADGTPSTDRVVRTKRHVTRELEANLIFDGRTAREFAAWLIKRADELDGLTAEFAKP